MLVLWIMLHQARLLVQGRHTGKKALSLLWVDNREFSFMLFLALERVQMGEGKCSYQAESASWAKADLSAQPSSPPPLLQALNTH